MAVVKQEHASTQLPDLTPEAQSEAIQVEKTGVTTAEAAGRKLQFARLVSRILHPFIVSPLAIVLILWLDQGNFWAAIGWAGLCAAFVVAPGTLYLRRKLKQKQYLDVDVSVREQRYGFYIFGTICMLLCFLVLIWLQAPSILLASFSAALAAILAAAIINRYWTKISIHAGTMAGVMVLAGFYSWPLALLLGFGALLVSWARLVTKRHTLLQTVLGWAVAASCVGMMVGLAGLLNR
jgi:hypothetical protein